MPLQSPISQFKAYPSFISLNDMKFQNSSPKGPFKPMISLFKKRKTVIFISLIILVSLTLTSIILYQQNKLRNEKIIGAYVALEARYELAAKDPEAIKGEGQIKRADSYYEFFKTYSFHPLAWQAALKAASDYYETSKEDQSIEVFEALLEACKKDLLQLRVRYSLATLYFKKNQYEKSLETLSFIDKIKENPIEPLVKLLKAQVLYFNGQKADSKSVLEDLVAQQEKVSVKPNSAESNYFEEKVYRDALSWLNFWNFES
jgi:predicted negative regulator of RcsB-dependent stress response